MKEPGSKERYYLSRISNSLKPSIRVGKFGLTAGVISAIDELLESRELIKIKFIDFKDEKGEIARNIAEKTGSFLVRIIGNIAILYRESKNPEKREISINLRTI